MKRPTYKESVGLLAIFLIVILIVYSSMNYIVEQYKKEDGKLMEIRNAIRPLNPEAIDKVILLEDTKSYTINKKKIYLCLRDEHGEYYNDNMLIFVAIHELAHVLCDEIGHTEKFESIFHNLLQEAVEQKIYDPNVEPIHDYCEY